MQKKIGRFIISVIILTFTITNIPYAQPIEPPAPYGPKVEDLKNKEELVRNLRDIERIRKNLSAVNISADSTPDDLEAINKDLEYYIQQFEVIEKIYKTIKFHIKILFQMYFFQSKFYL